MNCSIYYKKGRNDYLLHFMNQMKLSEDYIKEVFSEFGTVLNIFYKDKNGMHFILYRTLKETVTCIKGLQNNKLIQLLPERGKLKIKEDLGNKSPSDTKVFVPNKKKINNKILKQQDNDRLVTSDKKSLEQMMYNYEQSDNNSEINEGSIVSSEINKGSILSSEISSVGENFSKFSIESSITPQKNFDSPATSCRIVPEICEKNDFEIPDIICANTSGTSMESLNDIGSYISGVTNSKIVLAQHIVVANVHEEVGIHYILHLLESYNPVAISLMKTIGRIGIRYCHVYVRTQQDALDIERRFDKFIILGQRLIVLRSDRLLREFGTD